MPDPGSHSYDVPRTRLRDRYDDQGVPDQHADRAANEELQRENPPRPLGDPERAAGPLGARGTSRGDPSIDEPATAASDGLVLRSAAFSDHAMIPDRYSYDRDNVSPPLEWSAPPDGTAELVLLCEDPDAPNGTFVHWVVTGLPPDSTGVDEGALPAGAHVGRNGFGEDGWGGPRPPVGDEPHRYFFRLHAVDRPLDLGDRPSADEVRAVLDEHSIAAGTLVGRFGR